MVKKNLVKQFDYNPTNSIHVSVFARNASEEDIIAFDSKPALVRQRSYSNWFLLRFVIR